MLPLSLLFSVSEIICKMTQSSPFVSFQRAVNSNYDLSCHENGDFFSSLDIEQNSLFSGKVKSPNGTTGCTVFENHPKLSHLIFPCLF